jgi:hypothetical protein
MFPWFFVASAEYRIRYKKRNKNVRNRSLASWKFICTIISAFWEDQKVSCQDPIFVEFHVYNLTYFGLLAHRSVRKEKEKPRKPVRPPGESMPHR